MVTSQLFCTSLLYLFPGCSAKGALSWLVVELGLPPVWVVQFICSYHLIGDGGTQDCHFLNFVLALSMLFQHLSKEFLEAIFR